MISNVYPLPIGAAVQIQLDPPAGAVAVRVLRRPAVGGDWAVVFEGDPPPWIIDGAGLVDGVEVEYSATALVGASWLAASAPVRVSPATAVSLDASDPVLMVRNRLAVGLAHLVKVGRLRPQAGRIPVVLGSPLLAQVTFPLVTIHLGSVQHEVTGIGNQAWPGVGLGDDAAEELDAWLDRYQLTVTCWALNPDERALLRRYVMGLLRANAPVFAQAGVDELRISFSDAEDLGGQAPLYQSIGSVSFLAPMVISSRVPLIREVSASLRSEL